MQLYGRKWSRRDIESRIGRLEQIGGVRRFSLAEGSEAGVELIQVRTGAGLTYYVSPLRGLDISLAEFGVAPISWQSPNGEMHPAYYNPDGMEWLRTAAGGLLMTCGLRQVGSPGQDAGESLGLHGRVHHLPARHVSAQGEWIGDDYQMLIRGMVEETKIFGEYLCLTREIHSRMGENQIHIKDTVENLGFDPSPHMMLYHFNFGFPLLSEDTQISFSSKKVIPREKETVLAGYDKWQQPTAGFRERVYYHESLITSSENKEWTNATITNPKFPLPGGATCSLEGRLSWNTKNLPRLVQWKMPGTGIYVLGIEPANCYVEGRAKERERETLVNLEPGTSLDYELKLEINVK